MSANHSISRTHIWRKSNIFGEITVTEINLPTAISVPPSLPPPLPPFLPLLTYLGGCRKATEGLKAPLGLVEEGGIAATIFAVTDSLPGKSVGEAVQTITADEIKSEVEVRERERKRTRERERERR